MKHTSASSVMYRRPFVNRKQTFFIILLEVQRRNVKKKTTKTTINPPLANPPLEICVHCESEVSSECKCKFCACALRIFCSVDIEPNNFVELEDRTEFCYPKCATSKMPAQEDYNRYYNDMEAEKESSEEESTEKESSDKQSTETEKESSEEQSSDSDEESTVGMLPLSPSAEKLRGSRHPTKVNVWLH